MTSTLSLPPRLLLGAALLLQGACERTSSAAPVTAELYLMSDCPFADELLRGLLPALDGLGDDVQLGVHYIGERAAHGELASLYGAAGLARDLEGVCTLHHAGVQGWRQLVACELDGARDCTSALGEQAPRIVACAQNGEGKRLLRASYASASADGVTASPTLRIDGASYEGGRSVAHLARALCGSRKSSACSELGQAPRVEFVILEDAACRGEACDTSQFEAFARWAAAGADVRHLSSRDAAAQPYLAQVKERPLPIALVSASLREDAHGLSRLARLVSPLEDSELFVVPLR